LGLRGSAGKHQSAKERQDGQTDQGHFTLRAHKLEPATA
jgi:hypothetical protein